MDIIKTRKKHIQQRFKIEMGLMIDQPRSGSAVSSNDGNSARKFYQDPEKSADIAEIDLELIQRCAAILQSLVSGMQINIGKFDCYCRATVQKVVELYPWYYMPVTVHKILIHGSKVVECFIVSIGQLSEGSQESRNKDIKRYTFFK